MRAFTLFCAGLLMTCSFAIADTVTGTALYRERIAPPPGAVFVAVLEDISRADAPAVELGRFEQADAGAPPYGFSIPYDPAVINPAFTYVVRASLMDSAGRLWFTTDTVMPVLTQGGGDSVDITMIRVASDGAGMPTRLGAHGLRLPATFTGTLPCADCDGIAHHLDLWPDQTYHLRRHWLGGQDTLQRDEIGRWHADPERDAIVLRGGTDGPVKWQVRGPDTLRLLDTQGNPIESDLPYEITGDGTLAETDVAGMFLGGMMVYMADAALFEECLTGRRYPISMEGDYLALERAYLADSPGPGQPLYVHVEGGLLMRPAMEGPDRRSLVVDRVIRTRSGAICASQQVAPTLTGTIWRVDSLRGEAVSGLLDRREPHLVFHGGDTARFHATVGCNQMMGGFDLEGDALAFGPAAATLMACPPPLDALERDFSQVLDTVGGYQLDGETLTLTDAAGGPVASLTAVYAR